MPNWISAWIVGVSGTLVGYFAICTAKNFTATALRSLVKHMLYIAFKPPIIREVFRIRTAPGFLEVDVPLLSTLMHVIVV
jgi:hypothetical protein